MRTFPPRAVRSAFARASSSESRARRATFPAWLQMCRASTRPSPRDPPLIRATLSRNVYFAVRRTRAVIQPPNKRAPAPSQTRVFICTTLIIRYETFGASGREQRATAPRLLGQSRVFAIEARDFTRSLAINGALLQIGTLVMRKLARAYADFGFHLPVFPIQL